MLLLCKGWNQFHIMPAKLLQAVFVERLVQLLHLTASTTTNLTFATSITPEELYPSNLNQSQMIQSQDNDLNWQQRRNEERPVSSYHIKSTITNLQNELANATEDLQLKRRKKQATPSEKLRYRKFKRIFNSR